MKSKGEKYVISILKGETENSAKDMFAKKEVFFDALEEVKKKMEYELEKYESESIEVLKEEISGLKTKYEAVDDVLRGVIKTTEFNED